VLKRKRKPEVVPGTRKLISADLKVSTRFVCDSVYEGGVCGLSFCCVQSPPNKDGDFACYTYKAQFGNNDPRWVSGKHHPPVGRERELEKVNVSNVVVLVPKLLLSKKFPQSVVAAIKTHPAYRRVGKKADSVGADSDSEDEQPLSQRVLNLVAA
jgi:hypothetical protein